MRLVMIIFKVHSSLYCNILVNCSRINKGGSNMIFFIKLNHKFVCHMQGQHVSILYTGCVTIHIANYKVHIWLSFYYKRYIIASKAWHIDNIIHEKLYLFKFLHIRQEFLWGIFFQACYGSYGIQIPIRCKTNILYELINKN